MTITLSQQLEEYRAGWMQRVPADRRAAMERHIVHLAETGLGRNAKRVGDHAPDIATRAMPWQRRIKSCADLASYVKKMSGMPPVLAQHVVP